jgi:hypothetical protein
MTTNRLYITILAGLLSYAATAQDIGGFVSIAPTFNSGKSSVNTMMASYNEYYSAVLEKPFHESIGTMGGFTLMGGMYIDGSFEAGFGYGNTFVRDRAVFKNGDKQVITMNQQDFLIDMSVGTSFETPLKLSANLGMVFRESDVRLYYVHADGTKDYHIQVSPGQQFNQLNGLYHAWKLGFYTGASAGYTINEGDYRIFLRADYIYRGKGGAGQGTYTDNDPSKQLSLQVGASERYELPEDIDMYYNGTNAQNVFNSIKNDNWGWRIMLTFQININEAF